MTHHEQLSRNPRLLFWARAFMEVKAMTAVIVLFYLHRGVGLDQIFWLSIVWSITALVTEVPTGYLADRIGRKRTLLLGAALLALSYAGDWFAHGFWEFVPVFVAQSRNYPLQPQCPQERRRHPRDALGWLACRAESVLATESGSDPVPAGLVRVPFTHAQQPNGSLTGMPL